MAFCLLQRLVSLAGQPRDLCFLAAADELRGRTAFGAMRLLRATVFGRCALGVCHLLWSAVALPPLGSGQGTLKLA